MNFIKICCIGIICALVHTLSGCQQPQKAAAAPAPAQPAPTTEKPCGGQSSTPDPWINQHSEWELPGATVPEIYAAAKQVLIKDWKMPDSSGNRYESQSVDYLSALVRVTSALDTSFELSIVKLNEKSCRLAIDAKSKQIPSAQLEKHCSLIYDNIINYLNTNPQNKQKKEIWDDNQKMYVVGDYKFDYPVKHVFDAAIALLEQMHVSRSGTGYDDFAGQIWFKTGNNCELAINLQMTDEGKCLLTFFSRNKEVGIIEKWGEIFIQRLRQKLTEPQPAASSSTPESNPAKVYYGPGNRPSSTAKTVEYSYAVEKIDNCLKDTLGQLNISLSEAPQRDALTAKMKFKTANSAEWWVTISQIDSNRSKLLLSATNIYDEDFKKYTAAIIENLEKQLQQQETPAAQSTEPNSIKKRVHVIRAVPKN